MDKIKRKTYSQKYGGLKGVHRQGALILVVKQCIRKDFFIVNRQRRLKRHESNRWNLGPGRATLASRLP